MTCVVGWIAEALEEFEAGHAGRLRSRRMIWAARLEDAQGFSPERAVVALWPQEVRGSFEHVAHARFVIDDEDLGLSFMGCLADVYCG